jgi:two-component system sensor histidine kinase KdpD
MLTIIDEESDRLNHLVSEAVEMAQLDAQQVQMHFGNIHVLNLVQEALKASSWVQEKHSLHVNVPEDLVFRVDPALMEKVISNLLENAAKYSKPGTPITISAEKQPEYLALSVADRGIGIDPSEQTLIFERFYRARSQASGTSGTGMGLAISRAIVEAHGGSIMVTSQPGEGSVFTALIPAKA